MIKFQYVHGTGQWKWNITKGAASYETKLLEDMRAGLSGNQFTYACVNKDKFICMTTVPGNGTTVSNGTVVGVTGALPEMEEKPYCYITGWGERDLQTSEEMPEGELPQIQREQVDCTYFPRLLGPILDAVMRGKRQIVIPVESQREASDCMYGISYLLPHEYASRIGFSVGAVKIPDNNIRVRNDDGSAVEASVRIFFVAPGKESLNSPIHYVFEYYDEDGNEEHNYRETPSEFSRVITDFCLESQENYDKLSELIRPAFDGEGNVDMEMLDGLSLLFRFMQTDDNDPEKLETAKRLIGRGLTDENDSVRRQAFVEACRFVWDRNDPYLLDEQGVEKMADAYHQTQGRIFDETDALQLATFLMAQSRNLSQTANAVIETIILESGYVTDENIDVLFVNPDFGKRETVFRLLSRKLRINNDLYSNINLLCGAIRYFNISECFGILQNNGESAKGEKLFDMVAEEPSEDIRVLLTAALMGSCYATGTGECSPHTIIRVRGLRRMLNAVKRDTELSEAMTGLRCLYRVQETLHNLENCLDDNAPIYFSGLPYFLCEPATEWTQWVVSMVDALSFDELIALEKALLDRRYQRQYDGMRMLVEKRLFDPETVGANVRKSPETLAAFNEMFAPLRADGRYSEIVSLLSLIESEGNTNKAFLAFRWDFVRMAGQTLSDAEKSKIGHMAEDPEAVSAEKRESQAKSVQARFIDGEKGGSGAPFWTRLLPYAFVTLIAAVAFAAAFLAATVLDGLVMKGHSTIISRFMLLPAIATVSAILMFVFNKGMKLSRRISITAVETMILVLCMMISYYGSLMLLGLFL